MSKVLVVCLGNICRSPAAEAVLKQMAQDHGLSLHIDSCGLGPWWVGSPPNPEMVAAAKLRGWTVSGVARQFHPDFFDQYDLILAADREVLNELKESTHRPDHLSKLHLLTAHSRHFKGEDVPDPFRQDRAVFDRALTLIEDACKGWIEAIQQEEDNS